jgi:MinD superfamily P-loop ATPase
VRFGFEDHLFTSKYIASHDAEACSNCGTCVERCQFGAMQQGDEDVEFVQEKCFGCGVCLRTCPEEAISLVERTTD